MPLLPASPTLAALAMLAAVLPAALMLLAVLLPRRPGTPPAGHWVVFNRLSWAALAVALVTALVTALGLMLGPLLWPAQLVGPGSEGVGRHLAPWLRSTGLGAVLAVLVQLLGTVIGAFSARYLEGEPRQARYVAALAGVLAAVQLLLLADHWVVLIAAWALVGVALQALLCFYPDRPFALLAAHKKRLADRLADLLLVAAAALAWLEVGSGSLTDLAAHLAEQNAGAGLSTALQSSAVLLVAAALLRTALLPVHGWLIQVMEAPTPVSALLHAGVVNLGGFVLIRFAPLLEHATPARWLLVGMGLGTAMLAGMVMLTRISIKVRLAWSTVAQMGFMLMECGLGLYTLAALHLIGHSLYKAHAFLAASDAVRQTRRHMLRGAVAPSPASLLLAPILALLVVLGLQSALPSPAWPWWWSAVLALAWAPLLWLPSLQQSGARATLSQLLSGLLMLLGLTLAAHLAHGLPLGLVDAPANLPGMVALAGMAGLYLCLVVLQLQPQALLSWRRWSYAGFYLDESYTRLALRVWPARWADAAAALRPGQPPASVAQTTLN